MEFITDLLASISMLLGALLLVASGIGLVRFPDVFCRMHAAGKAGTLGIVMMITGAIIYFMVPHSTENPDVIASADYTVLFRGLLAIFFQFLTTPAATHLLARAAYLSDYPLSDRTAVDELKTYLPSRPDDLVGGAE